MEKWLEYDFNPFIVFSKEGKITSINEEAQYLMGYVSPKALFELALCYATASYGFKTTFLDLEFGRFRFFAITVGYEDDEKIGLKLYQLPSLKFSQPRTDDTEPVNIYTLIDLCISTSAINTQALFAKELDPTLPEIRLSTERFIKMLDKIYRNFFDSSVITTKLFLRVGEYIKFGDKKYNIFTLQISGENALPKYREEIEAIASELGAKVDFAQNAIAIDVPMIFS